MTRGMVLLTCVCFLYIHNLCAQHTEYDVQIVTSVESLVSDGVGRSRMFVTNLKVDHRNYTSRQTAGKKDRNKSNRKDIRLKDYEETKLLNLYNQGGIRFQNVASNDGLVTSKINTMLANGWDLFFVSTGVESRMADATVHKELVKMGLKVLFQSDDTSWDGKNDKTGLFITRYYFRKEITDL